MGNCAALIRAIDAYIAKADDDLGEVLDAAGFVDAAGTVDAVNALEASLTQSLQAETGYLREKLEWAKDIDAFGEEWPDIKEADTADTAIEEDFRKAFQEQVPQLSDAYLKKTDAALTIGAITKRTLAWVETWSAELGRLMKLATHTELERLLVRHLKDGKSVSDLTRAFMESGIREEYYRARRAAITEMLRAHSVAQQESLTQNPAVTQKEWVHTGSYRNEPRPNHVRLGGAMVPKGEPFTLDGADGVAYYPMYPRDSSLPPGESVNCHCIHRGIVDERIMGLSLDERRALQAQAIAEDDGAWERELDAKNRARAGIEVETVYKPSKSVYNEIQEAIHKDILENYNLGVNTVKQNKHIEGAQGYKDGRSILTVKPETLIKKYAGKSQVLMPKGVWNGRERFEHTKDIGIYKVPGGKYETPTKYGIFHYSSQNGVHIVPAKPPNFTIPKGDDAE